MLNSSPSLPYFNVVVNGSTPLPQWTPCVQIIQETNAHPIALLDVVYVGSPLASGQLGKVNKWSYLKEQTPIQINYGQRPHYIQSFLGYISSYKLIRSANDDGYNGLVSTTVQYTITGTSQVMQTTNNTAWKHTSPSTIAANIATNNGLRSIVHSYPAAIDYRLQNTSDFKFLNQLASEIGYRFYVDNTDLYFVNPKLILDQAVVRAVPQFWSYNQPGLYDTVRDFQPVVGTITPDGGIVANRNIVGLNPHTGVIVQASTQASLPSSQNNSSQFASYIDKYYNQYPAESYYEASQKITADANNNLYWNTAKTTLRGDARVKPNGLVNILGSSIPSTESGLWLVQSSTHRLTNPVPAGNTVSTTYEVDAVVARDQVYTATVSSLSQASSITQPVPGKLVGSRWRSTNLGASIYAT